MPGPLADIFIYDYFIKDYGYFDCKCMLNFVSLKQSDMLLENKQVAIIGGGPGGLTLARLLQQQGVNVKIYERDVDENTRPQGSSLDLHHDTGLKAMIAAGLLDEFKQYYRQGADKTVIVNGQMDVLFDEHADETKIDFGHEHFRPEIDRGPLRDLLINSLTKETFVWNARFMEMNHREQGGRYYLKTVPAPMQTW
jgi:2-polyprenyl-6-methoxyphenol hydroxylase-like FAD-dependent oxidoreductase